MKKTTMVLICIGTIGLLATVSSAALVSTLSNPGFDAPEVAYGTMGSYGVIPSWTGGGSEYGGLASADANLVIQNQVYTGGLSGGGYTSPYQIVRARFKLQNDGVGDDVFMFQSIGTVTAGDVGRDFTASADFAFKTSLMGEEVIGSVFFSYSPTGGDGGNSGTLLGSAASITIADGDYYDYGEFQNLGDATWTVATGDIGREVFVVLRSYLNAITTESSVETWFDTAAVTATPGGGPNPLPGDFDADNDVDGVDFGLWQSGFPTSSGAALGDGDADNDGDVDGVDFGIWQANYPTNVGSVATIPEPATLGLMLGGLTVLFVAGKSKNKSRKCV